MPTENVLSNGVMSIAVVNRKFVFEVIDRESPTTGVWVLDWVIYNIEFVTLSSVSTWMGDRNALTSNEKREKLY